MLVLPGDATLQHGRGFQTLLVAFPAFDVLRLLFLFWGVTELGLGFRFRV